MNKKAAILFICIACLLIACKSNQADKDKPAMNESEGNENNMEEQSLTLPGPLLQKGDQSDDVKMLQKILISLDYPVDDTGIYDDNTTWAITDIQLQGDIGISGLYDKDTKILEAAEKKEIALTPEKNSSNLVPRINIRRW